jgi:hypothetical protein
MIKPIEGWTWWLDEGQESGVWPCEVLDYLGPVFGVKVRPTHEGSLYYGQTLWVDHNRVYDSGFHRVREAQIRAEDRPSDRPATSWL